MNPLSITDTSFLFAIIDEDDKHHLAARELYQAIQPDIIFPTVIWPELAFHINRIGGSRKVAEALVALQNSRMRFTELQSVDYFRVAAILKQYHDSRIDFVDACIMALAERLNITRILTYDRRDFSLFRPAHVEHFTLLP